MNKSLQRKGQAQPLGLGLYTYFSAYSKTEGAKQLPQTIKKRVGVRLVYFSKQRVVC